MSNFINFSITVTILWTKLSRKAQRGNLAGASGVIWPVRSGSLCWIGRVAKRVVPIWLGSQPPAVAMRHNLPSRGWSTLRKSDADLRKRKADLLPVSGHVVKRWELCRKTRARTRSAASPTTRTPSRPSCCSRVCVSPSIHWAGVLHRELWRWTRRPARWLAEIFATDVLPHIVRHTTASQDNSILLLVDNHASHVSLEAVRFCRANGIHVLTFPPHCSHRLQPLDVAVYGPMKSAYKRALHDHQMAHPGRRIDLYQMADIFRRAYDGSFTRKNILKGLEASGVSPLNTDVFDETDFAPAAVSVPVVVPSADQPAAAVTEPESPAVAELELEPTAATVAVPEPGEPAGAGLRSPESIRPLPRLQVSVRKAGRKKGQSRVMTSTPERTVLEGVQRERSAKTKAKRVLQSRAGPSKMPKRTVSKR